MGNLRKHYGSQSFTGKVPVHGISKLRTHTLIGHCSWDEITCHFREIWKVVPLGPWLWDVILVIRLCLWDECGPQIVFLLWITTVYVALPRVDPIFGALLRPLHSFFHQKSLANY